MRFLRPPNPSTSQGCAPCPLTPPGTRGWSSSLAGGHFQGVLTQTVFFSAFVLPQPLKTMKSACSGSGCGPGSGRGLSGAESTRSMATSSWPPTFGSPPTAPTAEILSGKSFSPETTSCYAFSVARSWETRNFM